MITEEIKQEVDKIFLLSCLFDEAASISEEALEILTDVVREKLAKLKSSLIQ